MSYIPQQKVLMEAAVKTQPEQQRNMPGIGSRETQASVGKINCFYRAWQNFISSLSFH